MGTPTTNLSPNLEKAFERTKAEIIAAVNGLADHYKKQISSLGTSTATPATPSTPVQPTWAQNWFQGKDSTWDKLGIGGVVKRLFGGTSSLPSEGLLATYNKIQEDLEPDLERISRLVFPLQETTNPDVLKIIDDFKVRVGKVVVGKVVKLAQIVATELARGVTP